MIREGALWFTNLLVPDPLMIIPLIAGGIHLLSSEVGFGYLVTLIMQECRFGASININLEATTNVIHLKPVIEYIIDSF